MPKRLSFQLYSAREFPPLKDTLALLSKVGYREVEGYGGVYDKPAAVARLLEKNGLTMPTGHFSIDMLEGERPKVLEISNALGIRHIYLPYIDEGARPRTAAGYRKLGKRLAAIGQWVRSEGLGFGWHNHDFEFIKLATGEMPLEILFDAAPMMDWECDAAWIARAGSNPVKWIKRYAGRITAVHVKDIARKGECMDEDGWADAGHGILNWTAVLAALKSSRTLYWIMEHDNPNNLERFARRSFDYVSKI